MSNLAEAFNFLAGTEVLGSTRVDWGFDQTGDGSERSYRQYVAFQRPFRNPPLVHLGIAGFDISNQDAARLTASVANVTHEGFEIVLATWLHTRLWRVDVSWLALGA
jgi:hypothetical protein